MPAIQAGVKAPDIKLPLLDGREFSLNHARQRGPVVVAFFKVSCPVCQFAFPYLERIYQAYGKSGKATIVGVSQDNAKDTTAFNRNFGISFPTLLDELGKYPASNAYKLNSVPSIFLISPEGEVDLSIVGWSRQEMEELGRTLAEATGDTPVPVVRTGEKVTDFKPG
ncbi:MAG TPA: TlpA disulfide reductase family protein [Candidatus Angelobacter sp.]|jgi:peroxiredoxin|nr:TlpA disulfide reductase family protein [Candidatus Angelobacter sp.]